MKLLTLFASLSTLFLFSCQPKVSDPLEPIEVLDEYGYTEQYFRRSSNYAKEGWYKKLNAQKQLMEEAHYRNDTLDGLRILYYETGDTMNVETYRDGLFEGPFRAYHENGNRKTEGQYVANEMVGEWRSYYDSGTLRETVTFSNNAENGPFKEYYSNGNIKAEGAYLDGDNEHGELKLYDENGVLERTMRCDRGRCKTI